MTEDLGTRPPCSRRPRRPVPVRLRSRPGDRRPGRAVGLSGAPVELVDHESLQAVVCTVDLDEYGEDALTRNLEDLAWLEDLARTHNAVVFRAAEVATVAPTRLATICSDDASVRAWIADAHDALVSALDRVQGRVEMSVKVHATSAMTDGSGADEPATADGPGAGAAYLHRKGAGQPAARPATAPPARRRTSIVPWARARWPVGGSPPRTPG